MLILPSLVIAFLTITSSHFPYQNKPNPHGIWGTEWSTDGKYIALGGDDSTVWVFNGTTYRLHKTFRLNSMLKGMSWHPKENLLAVANMKGIQFLDMATEKISTVTGLKGGGRGIGWNYSGELLALADGYGVVQVMDKNGRIIRSIPKHNKHSYLALDWHPTKNVILTGSDEVILFDTSGKLLSFVKHREGVGILSVKWHPSGEFYAVGDYGHHSEGIPTLMQFRKEDGTLIKEIQGHKGEIRNLRWSRDGNFVATASDALRIFTKNGELLHTADSKHHLWGLAWSREGEKIVTASYAPVEIKLWNREAKLIRNLN